MIKCSRCNLRFEMAFPGGPWSYGNIAPDPSGWAQRDWDRWDAQGRQARYVCHGCGGTIREEDRSDGEWVAAKDSTSLPHGYSVGQMSAPWVSAQRVLERRWKSTWESDFWNLVMGLAWDEGVNAFTEQSIKDRQDELQPMAESDRGPCYMGVDVGSKLDIVVGKRDEGGRPRTIKIAREDWESTLTVLDSYMQRYNVVVCVIDSAPEEHAVRTWADRYNSYPRKTGDPSRIRVWRQWYGITAKPGTTPEFVWDEKEGLVGAPRTEVLDRSHDELLLDRVLPRFDGSEAWVAYIAHHVNSKRVAEYVKGLEAVK